MMSETYVEPADGRAVCECGIDDDDRCGECGGCDCPENPGTCEGQGCISVFDLEQMRDEARDV